MVIGFISGTVLGSMLYNKIDWANYMTPHWPIHPIMIGIAMAQVVVLLILLVWWLEIPRCQQSEYQVVEFYSGVGRIAELAAEVGFVAAAVDKDYGMDYAKKNTKRSPMDINSNAGLMSLGYCSFYSVGMVHDATHSRFMHKVLEFNGTNHILNGYEKHLTDNSYTACMHACIYCINKEDQNLMDLYIIYIYPLKQNILSVLYIPTVWTCLQTKEYPRWNHPVWYCFPWPRNQDWPFTSCYLENGNRYVHSMQ